MAGAHLSKPWCSAWWTILPTAVAVSLAAGCSVEASGGGTGGIGVGGSSSGGAFHTGGTQFDTGGGLGLSDEPTGTGGASPTGSLPSFRAPVVSGRYLWSTNPQSGRVALIDGESLTTRIVPAGLYPTHLVAVPSDPERPQALVLNMGSSDATLLQLDAQGVKTARIATHVGANRWSVSASGNFAAAWTTAEEGDADPTEGLQEVTLIELHSEQPSARRLTAGYRPVQLVFSEMEDRLVMVSQRGISLVDLDTGADAWMELDEGVGREVVVTPDGRHALVSRGDSATLEIIPLDEPESRRRIELPGPVSDLDLAQGGQATAVIEEDSLLATFLVEEAVASDDAVTLQALPHEDIGSVQLGPAGNRAVAFANVVDSDRVTILELVAKGGFVSHRTESVQAPVESIAISTAGDHAIAIGRGAEGRNSGSFAILSLAEPRFPRVIGTRAPVRHVALADDFGVVTAQDQAGRYEAHVVSFGALAVESYLLPSPPLAAGVIPESNLGFVSQEHPEGRVTFFGYSGGRVRTLTGFELSAEVVE